MKFEVRILGSGAATPTLERNPTSQYIYVNERHFLIDCGEGTQIQLRKYKVKFQKIDHIFISHLHGDHYLGLMGYLSSLHLLGRTKPVTVYGPEGLKEIILTQLKISKTYLSYEIRFNVIDTDTKTLIFEDAIVEVYAFPLNHRIETYGYLIQEKKRPLNMRKEVMDYYKVPIAQIPLIKEGADFVTDDGLVIENTQLTIPSPEPRSYAFCSDTKYDERIIPWLNAPTLLYHEATFVDKHADRAKKTFHSTAKQAASIAVDSGAKQLILGHFSARYKDASVHLKEAKEVYDNTICVEDGDEYLVG